jgi:hypothetical protein
MASNADRAQRWMDRALNPDDYRPLSPNGNVYSEGDTVYSYGRHFPMAIVMRDRPRNAFLDTDWQRGANIVGSPTVGKPRWVLVNGDRYSVTTSGHQSTVRSVVERSGLPSIIVPFSALRAAGIDLTSIRILEVRPDRWETYSHSADEVNGPHVTMDDPSGATVERTRRLWNHSHPDADDSGFYTETYDAPVQVPDPNRRKVRDTAYSQVAELGEDGRWHWETRQHFLGDSLFSAKAHGRRRRFLSSFDYQESQPLYFLCELPRRSKAETVEGAYTDLRPQLVRDADAAGVEVTRQGDMFAVPTTLSTREIKLLTPHRKGRIVKRPARGLLGTNHTASEVLYATGGRVYARGVLYHEPGRWREPDHARRKMGDGKTWHLLTKNTVPTAKARERTAA